MKTKRNMTSEKIRIVNQHKKYKINIRLVNKIVEQILKSLKKPQARELEFIFLDDKEMKVLNKKYKGEDRSTDVLSFDLNEGPFSQVHLGEAFISIDKAFENSKLFGSEVGKELTMYIIHAILHLYGYDDMTAEAKRRMWGKQEKMLEHLCLKEDLSKVLMQQ